MGKPALSDWKGFWRHRRGAALKQMDVGRLWFQYRFRDHKLQGVESCGPHTLVGVPLCVTFPCQKRLAYPRTTPSTESVNANPGAHRRDPYPKTHSDLVLGDITRRRPASVDSDVLILARTRRSGCIYGGFRAVGRNSRQAQSAPPPLHAAPPLADATISSEVSTDATGRL